MSPRFDRMVDAVEIVEAGTPTAAAGNGRGPRRNLLTQETVLMTVLAQDPLVHGADGPVRARIPVPAERLQGGPRGHRFAVVDRSARPVALHVRDPWVYRDRWSGVDPAELSRDRGFRGQNVYAVAAHTLALVEQHLGRPVPWHSGAPQLRLLPQALMEANAYYSRRDGAVLFGWVTPLGTRPVLYTALSYDVIAHEVTHAVLDGLRPRYAEPGLPDQLAFHEALADLVALLSVFTLDGVAECLLEPVAGRVHLDRAGTRAQALMDTPLTRLAEQVGSHRRPAAGDDDPPGLRASGLLRPGTAWQRKAEFDEPHRRSEVLVAAVLHTLVAMWAGRLEPLAVDDDGALDSGRVAEEGVKSARHLLGMLLRALDYLPPVDLEFADVVDAVLTADTRLAPEDDHGYRTALRKSFARFGIRPPRHRILDEDGVAAPAPTGPAHALGIRYEHLNLAALRTSPEEVYSFLWNNAETLEVDVAYPTRVERVLGSTRVGPDGLVVTEILADYTQTLRTTAGELPPGITAPAGMAKDEVVELWGGGVLVFDQFGRFRLHQRQPLLDADRQNRRLQYLSTHGGHGTERWGATGAQPFALLHGAAPT
ncbi:hypothetical protein E4P39_00820 [Blastococcus sp. CT_GayMR19]|uniref:hypothetical protein n=1 Tax=Blastococcus sp. CT_GayMR19 TaxID=2559608 RepID=UPI0010742124|nr:hypothetical protein [Blastococcus sp. CT_GayMR19]TFV79240.1 hypothetical protein E4P39_00820 [Blastococcus sp. CT_GayMR19]